MAKNLKIIMTILYRNSQSNVFSVIANGSSYDCTSCLGLISLQIVVNQWRDLWCIQFSWIKFNANIRGGIVEFARIEVGA
jgi:hypothetical protein